MDELFDGLWGTTIEWLTDGRWQAQVVAAESCTPSEWGYGDTPQEAMQAAIDSLPDNDA